MRQIFYVSESTVPHDQAALDAILTRSRHNNALDGVTGLLWSDGARFAQVIEGDERAIEDAMGRILADPRHHRIEVLHDRPVTERQFGSWSMDLRDARTAPDTFDERLRRLFADASDRIRETFGGLIAPA